MKKLIYFSLLLASLCTLFSCRDEDYDCFDPTSSSGTLPEQIVKGIYSGTYTRSSSSDTAQASGTMTLVPSDTAYCVNISFYSEDFKLDVVCRLNIMPLGNDCYAFEINDINNALAATILGRIDAQRNITSAFVYKQRVGRVTSYFNYSFAGSLSSNNP